jgi:hypothetical protein
MLHPGDCSPSRSVVSKMTIGLGWFVDMSVVRGPIQSSVAENSGAVATDDGQLTTVKKNKKTLKPAGLRVLLYRK